MSARELIDEKIAQQRRRVITEGYNYSEPEQIDDLIGLLQAIYYDCVEGMVTGEYWDGETPPKLEKAVTAWAKKFDALVKDGKKLPRAAKKFYVGSGEY